MQISADSPDSKSQTKVFVVTGALFALVALAYWSTFAWLIESWWDVPDYVYGFLIVPFSAVLLWDRRELIKDVQFQGSLWGLLPIAVGAAMRWYSAYEFVRVGEALSIVPLLLGVVLLVGGWKALRWAWSAVVFLVFMVPLPGRFAGTLALELQKIATTVSVFTLQTLGTPAVAEGNVIVLSNPPPLEVATACSGLRMLMLFFAACIGAAFYIRRDWVTRVVIALSAIPIAIVSNVIRITVTAFLSERVSHELGNMVFHDLAGWFMMPIAIALLWLELALLTKLFTAPEREAPLAFGMAGMGVPDDAEGDSRSGGRNDSV